MSSSALCVSVLFPLVCILTLSSGVIVLYVTMSVASSLGLPQPPVAVQAAAAVAGANSFEPYDSSVRIPFWNGVANEVVFEKDVAMKGRLMGAQIGGLLTFGPTPTQAAGVETTYANATIQSACDFLAFETSQPFAVPTFVNPGAGSPATIPVLATTLELNYKRIAAGGTQAMATPLNSMPCMRVRSVFTDPAAGSNKTVQTAPGTNVPPFSAPVVEFPSGYQTGIVQIATTASTAVMSSPAVNVPGLDPAGGSVVLITPLSPMVSGAIALGAPYVTIAQNSFTVNIPAQPIGTANIGNLNFAWFVVKLNSQAG